MRNEEVLFTVKKKKNILHEISKRIGHILRRNCLLQRVIEGMIKGGIEVTGRRGKDVGNYWMTLRKVQDTSI